MCWAQLSVDGWINYLPTWMTKFITDKFKSQIDNIGNRNPKNICPPWPHIWCRGESRESRPQVQVWRPPLPPPPSWRQKDSGSTENKQVDKAEKYLGHGTWYEESVEFDWLVGRFQGNTSRVLVRYILRQVSFYGKVTSIGSLVGRLFFCTVLYKSCFSPIVTLVSPHSPIFFGADKLKKNRG